MKIRKIRYCYECPYFFQEKEFPICTHSNARKGAYKNIISNRHSPEPIPKWCPLIGGNKFLIRRDSNDKIISSTKLILIS